MQPVISVLQPGMQDKVLEFYAHQDYHGGAKEDDILVGAHVNGELAGVVRLCFEEGIWVLRGMFIDKAFQRRRTGSAMLKKAEELLGNNECYCIPYSHLESFYNQAGFRKVSQETAPAHLRERFLKYQANGGKSMIIMHRRPHFIP